MSRKINAFGFRHKTETEECFLELPLPTPPARERREESERRERRPSEVDLVPDGRSNDDLVPDSWGGISIVPRGRKR